jgi:transcriptional regulator with PAS, ATPase and Fis domain
LPSAIRKADKFPLAVTGSTGMLKDTLNEAEKHAIIEALKNSGNNRTVAANRLGIHRTGLYQKMKKYHLL